MYIKKYYINYGGSSSDAGAAALDPATSAAPAAAPALPVARAIYEFKAGKYALPMVKKAVEQLSYNKEEGKKGLCNLKAASKTKIFKTADTTKEIIVIYDNDPEYFLPIFLEANSEKKIIIDLALDKLDIGILDEMKLFVSDIEGIIDDFSSNPDKDFIVYEEGEFKKIKESNLYTKFESYKTELDAVIDMRGLETFLKRRINNDRLLELIVERERILTEEIFSEDYELVFNKFKELFPDRKETKEKRTSKEIRTGTVLREVKNAIENGDIFNNDQKIMILKKKIDTLKYHIETNDKIPLSRKEVMGNKIREIESDIEIRILKIIIKQITPLNEFFYSETFRNYKSIDDEIYELFYATDANAGSQLGILFETLISKKDKLQSKIINMTFEDLDLSRESIKTYFSYTHGKSDVDMAFI